MKAHGWRSAEVVSTASHLPRAGIILSQLPLEWRTHAAPPLEPESAIYAGAAKSFEVVKTVRYLVWATLERALRAVREGNTAGLALSAVGVVL